MDPDALARRVAEHMLSREGTGPAWGLEIEGAGAGWARVAMTIREDMLNGLRMGHGGMIFALADTAFAYACNSRNVRTVAQSGTITFLKPAQLGQRLVAEAREIASEGRSGTYLVSIRDALGETLATFHGLCRTVGGPVLDAEATTPEET
jgi:acyl-CoA thioesterase